MPLVRLSERISYLPHVEELDRPVLALVRGDRLALAVDAGYSPRHVEDFYRELVSAGLPLPDLTALTHWHWDHGFGMGAVAGLTVARKETNEHLLEARRILSDPADPRREDMRSAQGFAEEFPPGEDPVVVTADLEFEGELAVDLGGVTARLIATDAPHTNDSTLVYVPEELTLFVGDCFCEDYDSGDDPSARRLDPVRLRALLATIEGLDPAPETFVIGHCPPEGPDEFLGYLHELLQPAPGEGGARASAS